MQPDRTSPGHDSEFLWFALTPPRATTTPQRAQEIADATLARLDRARPDGLLLYDIDDETDRNASQRPFPFMPTMDPASYLERHLTAWHGPVVVYRAVRKYSEKQLRDWLAAQDPRVASVFVGAPSRSTQVATSLPAAYTLYAEQDGPVRLGGVAIPERHTRRGDEHLRVLAKTGSGCSFFVTQVVYDVNAAKNLVSDYHYECVRRGVQPRPVVFTFAVVGSVKTLEFLHWLGVDVPAWVRNEIVHSGDPLGVSYEYAAAAAREIARFCRRLGCPFGLSVESVSSRKAEVEKAAGLALHLRGLLDERRT